MAYVETTATKRIKALTARIRVAQGGTSASKTISILLYLIAKAQTDTKPTLTSIVSETFPHLKRGAMKDFLDILETHGYYQDPAWNRTDSIYTFETGSRIEFFSADQSDKVRGPRRDRLFINEANNVTFEVFDQLEVRTKEFIFLDFNPSTDYWLFTQVCNCGMKNCHGKRSDTQHIILTYLDNEGLPTDVRTSIEQRRDRKGWWTVYGEGQLGEVEGKIYSNWAFIDSVPHEARLERYGVDFGFSNDPTAVVAIYYYNGGYIIDEILFQKGLSNKQIADTLLNQPRALTIADSADPKSIDEIHAYGINIQPAVKGKDSVAHGIQAVQAEQISVTQRSTNVIHEYKNYLWETNRDGEKTGNPDHLWSHSMDAVRYAMSSLIGVIRRKEFVDNLPQYIPRARVNPAR